jgi:hypothetical protein
MLQITPLEFRYSFNLDFITCIEQEGNDIVLTSITLHRETVKQSLIVEVFGEDIKLVKEHDTLDLQKISHKCEPYLKRYKEILKKDHEDYMQQPDKHYFELDQRKPRHEVY